MKEIALTQGKVALVDDEDFEAISSFKWSALKNRYTFYAKRNVRRPDGGWTTDGMHCLILARKLGRPIAEDMECDHDNGDGLDNRRENLREGTNAQNQRNRHHRTMNLSSQYLGVSWRKDANKWRARVNANGKSLILGCYQTELAAAKAREAYITAHPELCARSNF